MVPCAPLLSALEAMPDPRRAQGRRYPLPYLLLFSVLAVLAGATSYRGILVFIAVHRERLDAVFGASGCTARPPSTPCATSSRHSIPPISQPPSAVTPGTWPRRRRIGA